MNLIEMRANFHRMIARYIKKGVIDMHITEIKPLVSETSKGLVSTLGDPTKTKEQRKNAAKALFALSAAEDDLNKNL